MIGRIVGALVWVLLMVGAIGILLWGTSFVAGRVRASAPEGDALMNAMAEVNDVMTTMNEGDITPAAASVMVLAIRDDRIGAVDDYSATCRPVALYTWVVTDILASAMANVATDPGMGYGYSMLAAALFYYPAREDNLFLDALSDCMEGT